MQSVSKHGVAVYFLNSTVLPKVAFDELAYKEAGYVLRTALLLHKESPSGLHICTAPATPCLYPPSATECLRYSPWTYKIYMRSLVGIVLRSIT